jgi:hypothetical protein
MWAHAADACFYADADDRNEGAGKDTAAVHTNSGAILLPSLLAPSYGHYSRATSVDVAVVGRSRTL